MLPWHLREAPALKANPGVWNGKVRQAAQSTGRLRCGVVHTASYTQPLVVLLYYVRSCSLVLGIVQHRVVKTADLFTVLLAQL